MKAGTAAAKVKIVNLNTNCESALPPPQLAGLSCQHTGGTSTFCTLPPADATAFYHRFTNLRINFCLLHALALSKEAFYRWKKACYIYISLGKLLSISTNYNFQISQAWTGADAFRSATATNNVWIEAIGSWADTSSSSVRCTPSSLEMDSFRRFLVMIFLRQDLILFCGVRKV